MNTAGDFIRQFDMAIKLEMNVFGKKPSEERSLWDLDFLLHFIFPEQDK